MSTPEIDQIRERGISFRMPAGLHDIFTQKAADSMVGKTTTMSAHEFGYEEVWKMKIIKAKVVRNGKAMDLTLIPVPQ